MLTNTLKNAPENAGIYQFFNASGMLLYVGKAKNIKNRVKSYFRFSGELRASPLLSSRIAKMISEVERVEFIVVQSEHDALILENSLIKQLKPKYNILLRDDKTYPYIAINLAEPFPRFEITRKIINDKNIKYFGPLSGSAKALLDALYLTFPLVQKKGCLKGKKACLFFQIERCLAPCEGKIDTASYAKIVHQALEVLNDQKKLISLLHVKMEEASLKLNFEEAAKLRDTMRAIKESLHVTHVELLNLEDYDVFAVEMMEKTAVIMRLFIRHGKIVSTSHSMMHNAYGFDKEELYQRALFEFYNPMHQTFAQNILLADFFNEADAMRSFLSEKFGMKISISVPKRGEKEHLTALARENAKAILMQQRTKNSTTLLEQLQSLFTLHSLPKRIEVFDNSHLGGVAPVGAMVVWDEGFSKSSYRRYALHYRDEYAQMKEMLERRIADFSKEPPPDLWVLDGGETLRKLAETLLEKAGVHLDVLAIAKEKVDAKAHRAKGSAHDLLYAKEQSLALPPHDKRLQFLQRLRDEAHRFAIRYHQSKKQSKDLALTLQSMGGIGDASIKKLLSYFGTFEAIYQASEEELMLTLGKKLGSKLFTNLKK
ncbi:excinuclease ABC subunit UvrC [Sulfurospirillum barnesii]|uniref:UvrABC system protein C n=1 Tax=Sulfurospirillum barnesii (strain ATCC 700032 / DSM 10660 / SES-3) TaxID=760154 RepID=I3XVH9_SULBS|nr:excinuclease ABC subunit UvrC [Sulfurospirillum barnesii]AFL67953.1 Excinuclease ABC subunit C [Sulfurospirillum barnesii SES-3]